MRRLFATSAGVLVIVAAMAIARGAHPAAPTGDGAVIESYVIHAGEGHLLVGPYSRFQWHHPGPLYFYVLSPFYAAGGHRTAGLSAAASVINLGMIVLAVWTAATAGEARLAAAIAAMSTLYLLRAGGLLASTWNPHIVVFATLALAMTCAAAAAGRVWLLPVSALLASFVAETDVGVLPVAVLLGGLAVAASLTMAARKSMNRRAAVGMTLVVLAVSWLPSVVEQFRHTPGNFSQLWAFFSHRVGGGQPLPIAVAAWADMLSGPLRSGFYLAHGWILKPDRALWPRAWAAAQLILLALAAAWSFRRRRRFLFMTALFLFAASIAALWSVTRIAGDIMDHEVFWISALGAMNAAVIADWLSSLLWPGESPIRSQLLLLTSGVLVVLCISVAFVRLEEEQARSLVPGRETTAILAVAPAIQEYLRREGVDRPLVMIDQNSWGLAAGVLLQLQKTGTAYAVDDDWIPMFTEAARATGRERVVLSIAGTERHAGLSREPGVIAIAASDPVFVDALPSAPVER